MATMGWLGVAQIWVSGLHITQGTVKVNDTYFATATHNTSAWRNLVMCQEVGYTLGLDHQDTNFTNPNLGTCMDYTNDPSTNQHPNQHDYDELGSSTRISTPPRPIPPGDPDFERLFPRRNDAESINRHLDDTMWLGRAHSLGHARQHLNLIGFALMVNALALHQHRRRRPAQQAA